MMALVRVRARCRGVVHESTRARFARPEVTPPRSGARATCIFKSDRVAAACRRRPNVNSSGQKNTGKRCATRGHASSPPPPLRRRERVVARRPVFAKRAAAPLGGIRPPHTVHSHFALFNRALASETSGAMRNGANFYCRTQRVRRVATTRSTRRNGTRRALSACESRSASE